MPHVEAHRNLAVSGVFNMVLRGENRHGPTRLKIKAFPCGFTGWIKGTPREGAYYPRALLGTVDISLAPQLVRCPSNATGTPSMRTFGSPSAITHT